VELYIDQALNVITTSSSPTFSLNTNKWSKGMHTLQLLAYDATGNAGSSAMVNITKSGDPSRAPPQLFYSGSRIRCAELQFPASPDRESRSQATEAPATAH
jgi:hypothetical protein